MPNLILEMAPEEGMHAEDLKKALMRKAQLERIRIEGQAAHDDRIVAWDSRPVISPCTDVMTLRWRYKQYQKT